MRRALWVTGLSISLLVTGCEAVSESPWRCDQNRCEMSVSGSPTLEILDARLKAKVSRGRVRVSGGGVDVTLNPGEAAMVDGVRVEVRSVDAERATIVVSRQ